MKNQEVLKELYQIIELRKEHAEEGSYTAYLFEQGLDKILKKCGEEATEVIIAAKNDDLDFLANEIGDLCYHLLVLMVEKGLDIKKVEEILIKRRQKLGNLKTFHSVDKNT